MVKHRLYVGNLSSEITQDDLRSKFSHFGGIEDLQLRNKNESYFSFISINFEDDSKVKEAIELMNNTKWRGSLIKVQVAKENFLDKLKREQQASNQERPPYRPRGPPPDRVATSIISFEDDVEGKAVPVKPVSNGIKKKAKEESSDSDSDDYDSGANALMPFKGIFAYPELLGDGKPAISSSASAVPANKEEATSLVPETNQKKSKEHSSNFKTAEVAPAPPVGVQSKLLSIAGISMKSYTDPPDRKNEPRTKPKRTTFSDEPLEIVSTTTALPPEEEKKGCVLNFKKRNSDMLRQKSLESKTAMMKTQQEMIKSSLATIKIAPPTSDEPKTEEKSKSKKRKLFVEDEEDQDESGNEEVSFKLRPQFEGKSGAKNLELSSKLASYDNRFVLDERFRDEAEQAKHSEADAAVELENEKETNFSILNDILVTSGVSEVAKAPKKQKVPSTSASSVIVARYDPEAEDEPTPVKLAVKPSKKSKKEEPTETVQEAATPSEEQEPEKPSYFIASNLKDLFSGDSASKSTGFSLLQAFGGSSPSRDPEAESAVTLTKSSKKSKKGRNPFKYDSSESEDDDEPQKSTNAIKPSGPSVTFNMSKRTGFFYVENDKRFEGIEDFFLKSDEKLDDVLYRFNNGERNELRLICRGKVKNTKRKSEKRILTLKRLKRRKNDKKFSEKKIEGSNAVPLGDRFQSKKR